jgi:hypothetical protein
MESPPPPAGAPPPPIRRLSTIFVGRSTTPREAAVFSFAELLPEESVF